MNNINIVLVEPEIPQNTGNIARTCAVIGASLHIVKPMGFEIDDAKLKRAGLDYWHSLDIYYYNSLDDFLRKNESKNMYFYTTKAKNNYCDIKYPKEVFIVFGKESHGLPEPLLAEHYDHSVRIPMRNNQRSLNLSNSVAIAAYEILRQQNFEDLQTEGFLTGRLD